MNTIHLTPDELLTTTRSVRKRLDLSRPVDPEVIEECVRIALQAPSASNQQNWHFVVVTDQKLRDELAILYSKGAESYFQRFGGTPDAKLDPSQAKLRSSAIFLVEHLREVPVLVIPCYRGRPEGKPYPSQAALWLSIVPAAWSFALAARSRGLGTTFTTFHLAYEKEAARLLNIPYKEVIQVALMPLAYTRGEKFMPAQRKDASTVIHWNAWEQK